MRTIILFFLAALFVKSVSGQVSGAYAGNDKSFIFRSDPTALSKVKDFLTASGTKPANTLKPGADGFLYGMLQGEFSTEGTVIFKCASDGTGFVTLVNDIDILDVAPIEGGICWVTSHGGIKRLRAGDTAPQTIHSFNDQYMGATLMAGSNGYLYGTTVHGGSSDNGTLFKMKPDGSEFTVLHEFDNEHVGVLSRISEIDGTIYGTCWWVWGSIFTLNMSDDSYKTLFDFPQITGPDGIGYGPTGGVIIVNGKIYGITEFGGTNNVGVLYSINPDGTNFEILFNFSGPFGSNPFTNLGYANGRLYGMSGNGGNNTDNRGGVFSIGIDGKDFRMLYSHNLNNFFGGSYASQNGFAYSADNKLIGVAMRGGANDNGFLFQVEENDAIKIILDFNTTVKNPTSVIQLPDSSYYGVGVADNGANVFKMSKYGTDLKIISYFGSFSPGPFTLNGKKEVLGTGTFLYKINLENDVVTNIGTSSNHRDSIKYALGADKSFYGFFDSPVFTPTNQLMKVDSLTNSISVFFEPAMSGFNLSGNCITRSDTSLFAFLKSTDGTQNDIMFRLKLPTKAFQIVHTFDPSKGELIPYRWVSVSDSIAYGFTQSDNKLIIQKISLSGKYSVVAELPSPQGDLTGNIELSDGKIWGSFASPFTLFSFDMTTQAVEFQTDPEITYGTVILTSQPAGTKAVAGDGGDEGGGDGDPVTGISEKERNVLFAYPNPADDHIVIAAEGTDIQHLELMSAEGQPLPVQWQNTRVDTSELRAGVYMIRVQLLNSTSVVKFIKK